MPERRMVKKVCKWEPISIRPLGRPKNRWESHVRNDTKNLEIKNWISCNQYRNKWKSYLNASITIWLWRNMILNSVRQHNHFITEGNYIGYMFRLSISHLQEYFCQLSHKMLCTLWDSYRVYNHGIHQIRSFVSKGVTC